MASFSTSNGSNGGQTPGERVFLRRTAINFRPHEIVLWDELPQWLRDTWEENAQREVKKGVKFNPPRVGTLMTASFLFETQ